MVNEEIVSALRNAIQHGESLQSAVKIMIDSGYNVGEVQEASRFVGTGTLNLQPTPEEHLIMPEQKKTITSKIKFWQKDPKVNQGFQQQPMPQLQKPAQPLQQYQQKPQIIQQPQKYSQQPVQKYPQQTQQITTEQIKQSFYQPFQQYPMPVQHQVQKPQQIQQSTPQVRPPMQQYAQAPRPAPTLASRPVPQPGLRPGELSRDLEKIKPAKPSYTKEIILFIILLILLGVLVATIFFRDTILSWFA